MVNIYCLSGLGADERVFRKLRIKNAHLIFVPWAPFDRHDEIPCYAQKMATRIPEKNPVILGLSFGGMISVEIAKLITVKQVILISSAKGKQELPEVNNLLQFLVKKNLLPYGLFKKPNSIIYDRFGARTEEEKELLNAIMRDTDNYFLSWAFKAILAWENTTVPPNVIHIHGTRDRIIQPAFINADYWIRNGEHMMIYSKADDISRIIEQHI